MNQEVEQHLEDAINQVQRAMQGEQTPCKTLDFLLTGAEEFWLDYWMPLAEKYRLSSDTAQHLAAKFGTNSPKVLELAEQEPQLLRPLYEGGAPIRAEVVYVIREEMAQTIEDVLLRRLGVQVHSWKEAALAAPVVCQLLGREFGWSESQSREALGAYLASIQHLIHSAGIE